MDFGAAWESQLRNVGKCSSAVREQQISGCTHKFPKGGVAHINFKVSVLQNCGFWCRLEIAASNAGELLLSPNIWLTVMGFVCRLGIVAPKCRRGDTTVSEHRLTFMGFGAGLEL